MKVKKGNTEEECAIKTTVYATHTEEYIYCLNVKLISVDSTELSFYWLHLYSSYEILTVLVWSFSLSVLVSFSTSKKKTKKTPLWSYRLCVCVNLWVCIFENERNRERGSGTTQWELCVCHRLTSSYSLRPVVCRDDWQVWISSWKHTVLSQIYPVGENYIMVEKQMCMY